MTATSTTQSERPSPQEPADETPRKRWFVRHPVMTLGAITGLGCVVVVLGTEMVGRLLEPEFIPNREERVKFWHYSPRLGWAHEPLQRGRFNHRDFSVNVSINSHGFRDDEYSVERTEKRRMLVIGDSFVWGFGVEARDRFSEVIEAGHPEWEILNAGVSGYATDQEYLALKGTGLAFKPDVVLLLVYENDFVENIRTEVYWYNKPRFILNGEALELRNVPVPGATFAQAFDRFLLGRTYLGRKYYNQLAGLKSLFAKRAAPAPKRASPPANGPVTAEARMISMMRALLTAMRSECTAAGAKFVVVNAPLDAEKLSWLEGITEDAGIPHLSLNAAFDAIKDPVTFPHDAHWNEAGHKLAAQAIEAFLRQQGVFAPESPR
ncbi:MAG: SGNH/GDSL hydrolase family protein [Deltaproteobacteria bacterium]|nr:SGNH/GDSL hydrolase family protein [Deltaproteobacteria bacterium]